MVRNEGVSTIMARARRRLRASQIARSPRILDPFEIDVVREAEDAADDLGRRKSHRVLEQPVHIGLRSASSLAAPSGPSNSTAG